MICNFLNVVVEFKVLKRDDSGNDLSISVNQYTDSGFINTTLINCILESDIDKMIAELKECKTVLHNREKLEKKLDLMKAKLKVQ